MSDLRETIIDAVELCALHYDENPEPERTADAILAAVAEALTSPEALEAARLTFGGRDKPVAPYVEGCLMFDAMHAITAALRAAGIVKGDE